MMGGFPNAHIWQKSKHAAKKKKQLRGKWVQTEPISVAVMDKALRMSSLRTPTPCRREEAKNTAPKIWKRVQVDRKDSLQEKIMLELNTNGLVCWKKEKGYSRPGRTQ